MLIFYIRLFFCVKFIGKRGFIYEESFNSQFLFTNLDFKDILDVELDLQVLFPTNKSILFQGELLSIDENDGQVKFRFFFPENNDIKVSLEEEKKQETTVLFSRYYFTPTNRNSEVSEVFGLLSLKDCNKKTNKDESEKRLLNPSYSFLNVYGNVGQAFYTRIPQEGDLVQLLIKHLIDTEVLIESNDILMSREAVYSEFYKVSLQNKTNDQTKINLVLELKKFVDSRCNGNLKDAEVLVFQRYFYRLKQPSSTIFQHSALLKHLENYFVKKNLTYSCSYSDKITFLDDIKNDQKKICNFYCALIDMLVYFENILHQKINLRDAINISCCNNDHFLDNTVEIRRCLIINAKGEDNDYKETPIRLNLEFNMCI